MNEQMSFEDMIRSRRKFKMFIPRGATIWKGEIERPRKNSDRKYYIITLQNPLARLHGAYMEETAPIPFLKAIGINPRNIYVGGGRVNRYTAPGCNVYFYSEDYKEYFDTIKVDPLAERFQSTLPNEDLKYLLRQDKNSSMENILLQRTETNYSKEDEDDFLYEKILWI